MLMEKTAAELRPTTKLQPHQERVLQKLERSGGVIVAHRLGGGKTLTSIAAATRAQEPLEVIAPASLVANYEKEIRKHTTGELPRRIKSFSQVTLDASRQKATLNPNSLLVIDEAHRLRNIGTKQHKFIAIPAREAKKRLLLTGTPIYNRPSDIAPLANIAAGEARLPENPSDFNKEFLKDVVIKPGFFRRLTGVQPGIQTHLKNEEVLRRALAGHVDIYEGDNKAFPSRIDEKIHVPMSAEQHRIYQYHMGEIPYHIRAKIHAGLPPSKQESKDLNAYLTAVRQTSLTPRPYIHQMTDKEEDVHTPKITKAVGELHSAFKKEPNFRGVVYSNWIGAGLTPYSRQLTQRGITHNVFTGAVSKPERARMVQDYNSGKVPVLLVSSSGTEGLDLKGTKLMQVLEPHFNNSKINQVIGRGIRYKSHTHLPESERVVRVQRYYSTVPQGRIRSFLGINAEKSTEEWLQDRANDKDVIEKQFKQVMREAHNLPPQPNLLKVRP
jgi:SNF2 family DNA or RNA helicase